MAVDLENKQTFEQDDAPIDVTSVEFEEWAQYTYEGRVVKALDLDRSFVVKSDGPEDDLGLAGDFLVEDDDGGRFVVERDVFRAAAEPVAEGEEAVSSEADDSEQTEFEPDAAYVRSLERRLRDTEADLNRMRDAARRPGVTFDATMAAKATFDWKTGALEIRLLVTGAHKRYGFMQQLAELKPLNGESVPVNVNIQPMVDQQTMDSAWKGEDDSPVDDETQSVNDSPETDDEEEPQAASEDGADRLPAEDATSDDEQPETHVPSVLSDHELALLDEPYEGTELRVYACRGNWNKDQLAEAAFRGGLPECVIRLTREVARGEDKVEQVHEYVWDGDKQIERLTAAKKPGFVREHASESA